MTHSNTSYLSPTDQRVQAVLHSRLGLPLFGYVYDSVNRRHLPDPLRFPIVKRLFQRVAEGVKMRCDLLACRDAGWQGVTLNTTRGHFYRAALEGLTAQLKSHLRSLEKIGGFKASELLLVGGGSRNALWNQIKANALDMPVKVLDDAETTVAGAAMYGWFGAGEFASPEQARAEVLYRYRYFYPQTEPELIDGV